MSIKLDVLTLLETHKGQYLSGEALADRLSVSRTSIWKAIEGLRKSGYCIDAVSRKGYCLSEDSDQLSVPGILPYLKHQELADFIDTYEVCESTNLLARQKLSGQELLPNGASVISESQTAGRGRLGRTFYSPSGSGIYLSMILKPETLPNEAVLITTAASVAVCRAIKRLTGKLPQIKWVNDLYLNQKKLCGISAEGIADLATGTIGTIILGIGINFKPPRDQIPEKFADIMGFLFENEAPSVTKNQLIAAILDEILDLLPNLASRDFLDDYRSWSMVLGKHIRILPLLPGVSAEEAASAPARPGVCDTGVPIEIDRDGALIVKMDDETTRILRTGEISIRTID